MSEQTQHPNKGGKHLAQYQGLWAGYLAWLEGLTRGQRLRYRILQVAGCISAIIVLLWAGYQLVVQEPEVPPVVVPPVTGPSTNVGDVSGEPGSTNPEPGDVTTPGQLAGAEEVHISLSGQREGVYTILVAGKDTTSGSTDTMILVTYDTVKKTVNAMSLPRDTMINVSWNTKKLNTVYSYYKGRDKATQVEKGMTALKEQVGKLTGITPNFYVVVEWDAVGELVEALGGITFDVPYNMDYDDPEQGLHIHQTKGLRKLSGEDAMQVIRWRKNNADSIYGHVEIGDAGRMKIQQAFLMAVAKEALQLKHLMNVAEFARIFTENVSTDLTVGNLIWFGQKAIGIDVETDVKFCTLPYTGYSRGTSYLLPRVDALLETVNSGMNPYQRDIRSGDLEVLCLNKDGSMSLTSGKLADPELAKVPEKPKQEEKPDAGDGNQTDTQPERPDAGDAGAAEPTPEQPGTQPEQPDTGDTGGTVPTPEQPENGDAGQMEQSGNGSPEQSAGPGENVVNLLPALFIAVALAFMPFNF